MTTKQIVFTLLTITIVSCNTTTKPKTLQKNSDNKITIIGAMKNVMWKGELQGIIKLDTITNKRGLFGIGPESFLTGELLINNGQSYVSRVLSDSTMIVHKTFNVSAPFFVYGNVEEWQKLTLPNNIVTITDLEAFISKKTMTASHPFVFKLIGKVKKATIHVQNLPKGTKVASPQEAHQGQINYTLTNEPVEIIGFFSTEHQGIFTHHDSYMHMHLITKDESKMGHLDDVNFEEMTLYIPLQ
ncbi:acetolactate decarboxylase [Formosa sp. Hel1_31_208]|uniref:acetolactate decarboxylase n=1 Tax=Formosa sp. Hel1_31_208 TaxID=1798225 RepID=UPI000879B038|nr:acetolactate decarboxylase [Formosa sp. Hel1_31_208]SDS41639.1 acetolactate decarboxylase [Formosa sp. Hel1_31_208]